jgi:RNA polymerase sigma factor (TIGR02999 family)
MPDDVTELLLRMESGDPEVGEVLLSALYGQLRKLAAIKMSKIPAGQTLQATALVHEAWLRIQKSGPVEWKNRAHFFSAAAEAMRRILVDQARRKSALRHGSGSDHVSLDEVDIVFEDPEEKTLLIHECLDLLEKEDPVKASIVKLKFFAGLQNQEIADVLDLSEKTVRRHWNTTKVRLFQMIEAERKI